MLSKSTALDLASPGLPVSAYEILNLGRIAYAEAWALQKELLEKRYREDIGDTLIFCEHDPVITLGRGSQRGVAPIIRSSQIPVFEIERGGQATYHGPGQLVAYPIFKLGRKNSGASREGVVGLIRALEDWVISYLKSEGLRAAAIPGKTGVWVNESRKIASIGIAARHWVSYHGLALNVSTGTKPWQMIDPCGFESSVMTDLQTELKREISVNEVMAALATRPL